MIIVLSIAVFLLAVFSGMFGIGVAFAAVPVLSFFLPDLVNQVQPLGLLLNGVTALCAVVGFALAGYVDWRKGGILALVMTLSAPIGAILVRSVRTDFVWLAYFASASYVTYQMFRPMQRIAQAPNFAVAVVVAIPIAVLSGFLGVGPGFLLMPVLVILGYGPVQAAGINSLAVTPPSFSALLPHLAHTQIDWDIAIPLATAGAVGSVLGARLATRNVAELHLRRIFAGGIAVITLYRAVALIVSR